ncbi:Plasmodium exported protein (hyp7), unknown, putative [Plasmodium sp. gorilla clade G1]|nr:Plasmodium exported protein (hyp7), unknown, putative [Plasmodium sp. gorilla clade G1]
MYFCCCKIIIYYVVISIFHIYNNDNIKKKHNQYDIPNLKKSRSLSTYENTEQTKKGNISLFNKKTIEEEIEKQEFIEDILIIDCSELNNFLKNTSYEERNMEIRDALFKGYEEMYSEMYGEKIEVKNKKNIFKKILSLLHRIPSKYIDKMLNYLMQDFVSVPIYVIILFITGWATCTAPCVPMVYSTIAFSYALVLVFALLLYLKKSESYYMNIFK